VTGLGGGGKKEGSSTFKGDYFSGSTHVHASAGCGNASCCDSNQGHDHDLVGLPMARSGSSFLLAHDDTSEHDFGVRYDIQSDILPGQGLDGGV
jgi:hypothetical protein